MLTRLVLLLLVAGCTAPQTQNIHTVRDDGGGYYLQRLALMEELKSKGRKVAIRGKCASACTLFLADPQTCVSRNARLGFHAPSAKRNGRNRALPPRIQQAATAEISKHYPPAIRDWFFQNAAHLTGRLVWMEGSQAIAMGIQECPSGK